MEVEAIIRRMSYRKVGEMLVERCREESFRDIV